MKRVVSINGVGEVTITKRRNARKMTLSINRHGQPNVTIPKLMPYNAGVAFARKQKSWIEEHRPNLPTYQPGQIYELYDGTHVVIKSSDKRSSTRRAGHNITIVSNDVNYVKRVINKHLLNDTRQVVEARYKNFMNHLEAPETIRFRVTTSRWGSCNAKRVITFSAFMAQLPNQLIDYVIVHELAHLTHMNHGSEFWKLVEQFDPDYQQHRKQLKQYPLKPMIKGVV